MPVVDQFQIDQLQIVSVNVGRPAPLGERNGEVVMSGIAKRPVSDPDSIELTTLNLAGDGQADLTVHGGPDKAVYAYPSEHLSAWSRDLGQELGPAAFGENLTTVGAVEHEVCIGDVWAWGDARLQVCQPRWPCFKLALLRGRGDIGPRMIRSGRSGWYLRVLEAAVVPIHGRLTRVERHPERVSVLDAQRALADRHPDPEQLRRIAALPELAESWSALISYRLSTPSFDPDDLS